MRSVVIFGVVFTFLVVLYLISGLLQPQGTEVRIIFSSAMDAPLNDPDFEVNPQKYFEPYTMNLDRFDIQRITENLFWENQPDVSPDGQRILCSIHQSAGRLRETDPGWEIAVMDLDGKNLVLLTDNAYLDFWAHWNRDGTRIVYVSDSTHRTVDDNITDVLPRFDIYVMNADGSGKEQLTFAEPGDVNADPSFSHTEPERILYIHSEGLSGSFDM